MILFILDEVMSWSHLFSQCHSMLILFIDWLRNRWLSQMARWLRLVTSIFRLSLKVVMSQGAHCVCAVGSECQYFHSIHIGWTFSLSYSLKPPLFGILSQTSSKKPARSLPSNHPSKPSVLNLLWIFFCCFYWLICFYFIYSFSLHGIVSLNTQKSAVQNKCIIIIIHCYILFTVSPLVELLSCHNGSFHCVSFLDFSSCSLI